MILSLIWLSDPASDLDPHPDPNPDLEPDTDTCIDTDTELSYCRSTVQDGWKSIHSRVMEARYPSLNTQHPQHSLFMEICLRMG